MSTTLHRDDVVALSRVEADPAVSIVLPLDRSDRSHDADRSALHRLTSEASSLLERSYPHDTARAVVSRLHALADGVDLSEPAEGLALFVDADEEHAIRLPFPVREQLAVEQAFATRQLLVGLAHRPLVRVLVLSQHRARVLDEREVGLVEVRAAGFPLELSRPDEQPPGHRDRVAAGDAGAEPRRSRDRLVDDALDGIPGTARTPLIVVAPERELATFTEVSHHRAAIVGALTGSYAEATAAEIEAVVRPLIGAFVDRHGDELIADATEAVGVGRAVTGFNAVWHAAIEGRGDVLLLEEGYTHPLHLTDGLTPGDEPDVPWTLDDAVDELIEHVMRAGGTVEFVAPHKLAGLDRIALLTRY